MSQWANKVQPTWLDLKRSKLVTTSTAVMIGISLLNTEHLRLIIESFLNFLAINEG